MLANKIKYNLYSNMKIKTGLSDFIFISTYFQREGIMQNAGY